MPDQQNKDKTETDREQTHRQTWKQKKKHNDQPISEERSWQNTNIEVWKERKCEKGRHIKRKNKYTQIETKNKRGCQKTAKVNS